MTHENGFYIGETGCILSMAETHFAAKGYTNLRAIFECKNREEAALAEIIAFWICTNNTNRVVRNGIHNRRGGGFDDKAEQARRMYIYLCSHCPKLVNNHGLIDGKKPFAQLAVCIQTEFNKYTEHIPKRKALCAFGNHLSTFEESSDRRR